MQKEDSLETLKIFERKSQCRKNEKGDRLVSSGIICHVKKEQLF